MKLIPLTQGKFAMVDDVDFDHLSKRKWRAAKRGNTWYAMRQVGTIQREIRMHAVVFGADFPDHIDRNGLNNQRLNLRAATRSQNGANRNLLKNNSSGFKGVTWFKNSGKWLSQIMHRGKNHYLGCYVSAIEAAKAYDSAAEKLFGEFAVTNKQLGLLTK